MIPNPCDGCRGEGRRMEESTFTVEVPAGVEDGSTLRLAGRGAAGQRGGAERLALRAPRRGARSALRAPGRPPAAPRSTVTMAQATLGAEVAGRDARRAAAGRDRRRGPSTGTSSASGASACRTCAAVVAVTCSCTCWSRTPTDLTPEQEELLRQFAAARGEEVSPHGAHAHGHGEGVFSRIRSAFG